jgi:hypothetical protein
MRTLALGVGMLVAVASAACGDDDGGGNIESLVLRVRR